MSTTRPPWWQPVAATLLLVLGAIASSCTSGGSSHAEATTTTTATTSVTSTTASSSSSTLSFEGDLEAALEAQGATVCGASRSSDQFGSDDNETVRIVVGTCPSFAPDIPGGLRVFVYTKSDPKDAISTMRQAGFTKYYVLPSAVLAVESGTPADVAADIDAAMPAIGATPA
jgi:hypothetical protein